MRNLPWLLTFILRAGAVSHGRTSPSAYDEAVDNGTFGYYPTRTFATENDIAAPKTNWLQWDSQCNDSMYYFLTPRGWGLPRPGPMILDWKGDLVWSKHFANEWGGQAYDFMVQQYQGQDVLTFWTGDDRVRGHGSGSYMMLDSSYELVHSVDAANDLTADLHEFLLTSEGTALLTIYEKHQHDLSAWRLFNATSNTDDAEPNWIWDCVMQEISIDTRDVIFEWRASEHIDINDTYHLLRKTGNHEDPFDWFHMNSIRKDEWGNYLVSARYTHSLSYIDGKTGEVIWILGGKSNMFMDLSDGHAINFAWQHDAQFVSPDLFPEMYVSPKEQQGYTTRLLSLFDNAAEDQNYVYGMNVSRGLLLEITFPTPGQPKTGDSDSGHGHVRDISHLRKLAADSGPIATVAHHHAGPGVQYPSYASYGLDTLQDLDVNLLKLAQTNGTNPSHTARMIQSYTNPSNVRSSSQGSVQILPRISQNQDAQVLVGYGLNAVFTQFSANGSAMCDAHYGAVTSWERGDIQSYRTYKFPWVGRPKSPPSVAVRADDAEILVSWNGATEVATWALQASRTNVSSDRSESSWIELARKQKIGFETAFALPATSSGAPHYVRITALDINGKALDFGVSDILDLSYLQDEHPLPPSAFSTFSAQVQTLAHVRVLTGGFLIVLALITLYEVYRRYLCWRTGRPSIGAVRWRKTSGYRLLGDV